MLYVAEATLSSGDQPSSNVIIQDLIVRVKVWLSSIGAYVSYALLEFGEAGG